jgi:arginine decarboxylase
MEAEGRTTKQLDLADFFSATEARRDRWSQLRMLARSWATATERRPLESEKLRDTITALLIDEIEPLEEFWAYPGSHLMRTLRERLADEDASGFGRLVDCLQRSLFSRAYRHDPTAWEDPEQAEPPSGEWIPPGLGGEKQSKPYFEVLVVTPSQSSAWERGRQELRRLRRAEDQFVYEVVQVGSFEDAVLGAILNFNIEAVCIYDGFPFRSRHALPALHELLAQRLPIDVEDVQPQDSGLLLAKLIKRYRPELDLYLITDRAVEAAAGRPEAKYVRRVFYQLEDLMEIHLSLLDGVADRYETPHFSNLKRYAQRPVGTFHALPIARGKSVFKSNWIRDMAQFYGANIFLAESSATSGGLDSLLEPTGNIKKAQEKAARAFGADHAYFVPSGTTTSIKIAVQALCRPGDIVLVDRNCHKSHHYAFVLGGVEPLYLEAYPMMAYSMYGGVPLRSIKQALLALKAEGKLHRARAVDLTNCTFDGHMYNVRRVMEECLAIKPDLCFIWDEAWFGFARSSPFHRRRTAMGAAEALIERYGSPEYRAAYAEFQSKVGEIEPDNPALLDQHLLPDPDKVRVRVYQVNSTHKSMSALRQGSMILVRDQDFHMVEEVFHEAWFTHVTTSPSHQIVASLDLARRQMELEGYELVMGAIELALELRREVNSHPLISKYFHILTPGEMVPIEFRASALEDYGRPHSTWREVIDAWDNDEFALDPTRITLVCGRAGFDGTQFKNLLAERYDVQLNKTSRNSVLLQTNINNGRSDIAHVIKVLAEIARGLEQQLAESDEDEHAAFSARVKALMEDVPQMPNFSRFHDTFRSDPESKTAEGNIRIGFYMAYRHDQCQHVKLASKEIDDRLANGPELVSANFVIPYPPGFPIMVPGQVITAETIAFMRKLDVKEIHGYDAKLGLKLIDPEALVAPDLARARAAE